MSATDNSIAKMLEKLSNKFDGVELTFFRSGNNGDCWWGVNCKNNFSTSRFALTIGGCKTPADALREAVRIAGTLK